MYSVLAHGALGGWDEVLFLGAAAIFMALVGVAWVKSRNAPFEVDGADGDEDHPA